MACNKEITDDYATADAKPYHIEHLTCDVCKQSLVGKNYLRKDNAYYCEEDYYSFYAKMCYGCKQLIKYTGYQKGLR